MQSNLIINVLCMIGMSAAYDPHSLTSTSNGTQGSISAINGSTILTNVTHVHRHTFTKSSLPTSSIVFPTTAPSCRDNPLIHCNHADVCALSSLKSLCAQTCGLCGKSCVDDTAVNCQDTNICAVPTLKVFCPLTCGLCAPPPCEDGTIVNCQDQHVCSMAPLRKFCPLTCGDCVHFSKPPCSDGTLVNCHTQGVCSNHVLRPYCSKTCGICGQATTATTTTAATTTDGWLHIKGK